MPSLEKEKEKKASETIPPVEKEKKEQTKKTTAEKEKKETRREIASAVKEKTEKEKTAPKKENKEKGPDVKEKVAPVKEKPPKKEETPAVTKEKTPTTKEKVPATKVKAKSSTEKEKAQAEKEKPPPKKKDNCINTSKPKPKTVKDYDFDVEKSLKFLEDLEKSGLGPAEALIKAAQHIAMEKIGQNILDEKLYEVSKPSEEDKEDKSLAVLGAVGGAVPEKADPFATTGGSFKFSPHKGKVL